MCFRYLSILLFFFLSLFITPFSGSTLKIKAEANGIFQSFCRFKIFNGFQCLTVLMVQHYVFENLFVKIRILSLFRIRCFYDSVSVIINATSFLSSWKLICFCFKLKDYGLFEFLNKCFVKIYINKSVDFELCQFAAYFCQFYSLVSVTAGRIHFPLNQNPIFIMVLFSTNGF